MMTWIFSSDDLRKLFPRWVCPSEFPGVLLHRGCAYPSPSFWFRRPRGGIYILKKSPGDSFSVSSQKFTLIFIFKNCASNQEWVHSCEEYSRVCRAIWGKPPSHPPLTLTALLRSTRSLVSHLLVGFVSAFTHFCVHGHVPNFEINEIIAFVLFHGLLLLLTNVSRKSFLIAIYRSTQFWLTGCELFFLCRTIIEGKQNMLPL